MVLAEVVATPRADCDGCDRVGGASALSASTDVDPTGTLSMLARPPPPNACVLTVGPLSRRDLINAVSLLSNPSSSPRVSELVVALLCPRRVGLAVDASAPHSAGLPPPRAVGVSHGNAGGVAATASGSVPTGGGVADVADPDDARRRRPTDGEYDPVVPDGFWPPLCDGGC
jgi:hypothetical protein